MASQLDPSIIIDHLVSDPEARINFLRTRYSEATAGSLFLYDYLLTFKLEVDVIWTSKWNLIKCLYLAQRYSPFLDSLAFTLYREYASRKTAEECARISYASTAFYMLGTFTSQALLMMCVQAMWRHHRRVSTLLIVTFVATWLPWSIFLCYSTANYSYAAVAKKPFSNACVFWGNKLATSLFQWSWICRFVWHLISFILVSIPAIQNYRSESYSRTSFSTLVYRDGIFYYIFLFVVSIITIAGLGINTLSLRSITLSVTRCLQSMLTSRLLLHMRDHAKGEESLTIGFGSALVFNPDESEAGEMGPPAADGSTRRRKSLRIRAMRFRA